MSAWPETLPEKPLFDGLSYVYPDLLVRTQTDTGPVKLRKRYTAGSKLIRMQFLFDATQFAAFETFYFTTTAYGTLSFTMDDPVGGTDDANMRFVDIPIVAPAGPGHKRVSFTVEVLP